VAQALTRILKSPRARRSGLLLVLWAVIFALLFAVREVLLPFFIAIFLAYVINPIVGRLSAFEIRPGFRLPRWGSVLTLYGAALVLVWLTAIYVVPQLYGELERLVRSSGQMLSQLDQEQIERQAKRLDGLAKRTGLPIRVVAGTNGSAPPPTPTPPTPTPPTPTPSTPDTLAPDDGDAPLSPTYTVDLNHELQSAAASALDVLQGSTGQIAVRLQALVGGLVGFVFKLFLVLMVTAFLLSDVERVKRYFFTLLPVEDANAWDKLLNRVDRGLSGVVRGQLTICFVNGVLTLIGLLLFQVKFAFLLATIAAIFSLIPIFGSITSTIPIVIVALATSGLWIAILMVLWILGIHALEANLLNPKIMGDAAKIHPVVIVVALVAGEHFYGIVGALFAVPVVSIGLTVFRSIQAKATELEERAHHSALAPPTRRPRLWREPLS
jgi:predicted PurR-regulated permease PerM